MTKSFDDEVLALWQKAGRLARRPLVQWRAQRRRRLLAKMLDYTGQEAQDHLRSLLSSERPVMVGRFGRNELLAVLEYGRLVARYGSGEQYDTGLYEKTFRQLKFQAGFFPITPEHVARFYHRMLSDMSEVDVLGSWMLEERQVRSQMPNAVCVELHDLDPVIRQHPRPWTGTLRGKRVLVVHPFDRSIRSQYLKRSVLFDNPDILPDFDLLTLRAPQNPAWNFRHSGAIPQSYRTWFEALEHLEMQVAEIDFDIALIGCGAYGFPLAAHIKRLGRKAVHLGGVTQMLFGIKGMRWLKGYGYTAFNEHWVFPLPDETPEEAAKVEASAYWGRV